VEMEISIHITSVPLCSPQFPHGMTWDGRTAYGDTPVTNCLSHDTVPGNVMLV